MGRSQETFGKKEREKNKANKRKEKEEKNRERKSNAGKTKSLEDMMAYIDEFGNITDTPPDPSKRTEINLEDIQLGAAKQEPINPADLIRTGMVKFFNNEKGYGFINDLANGNSVFVHINQLQEPIKERDKVTFEIEKGPKGPTAVNVKKV